MKLFKINSIQTKLFAFTSLLVLFAVLPTLWMSYSYLSKEIKQERMNVVGRVANHRHRLLVEELLSYKHSTENLLGRIIFFCGSSELKNDVRMSVKGHLRKYLKEHFDKACVLDRLQLQLNLENANGLIFRQNENKIAWTVGKIAKTNISEREFKEGQLGIFGSRGVENLARPFYIMASNKQFGVEILVEYPLEPIQKIFRPLDDLGNSGETFLADKEGYFITERRYHSHQGLSEIITANPMRTCLQKINREVLDLDYRAEHIIHGFRYVPEIGGGCIMAHIDQKEAFAPLKTMVQKIMIAAVFLIMIAFALIFIWAKNITAPLTYLANLAKSIAKGDYHLKSQLKRDDEIGVLSDAFNLMNDKMLLAMKDYRAKLKAEIENKKKSEFLANMSHEMRTPLAAVIGITESLMSSSLTEEQSALLKIAHNAGEDLLTIINHTLDLSRIESAAVKIENIPFLLSEQIKSCIAIVGIRAKEKNLILSWEIEEGVNDNRKGDPTRLRQIIINLLNNAVKFSEKGSVSLQVKKMTSEKGTSQLLFSITDQGIGIPEDKKKLIFESFKQADESITRQFGGSGLGLTISKKLVELMNGKIWVESSLGSGSTFFFTIDLLETDIVPDTKKGDKTETVRPLKILIADDNEENLLVFKLFLEKNHHRIVTVNNGQEAVEIVKKEKFDLVFLDVRMPVMDGLTAAKKIRLWEKENNKKRVPIITCSANAFEADFQESLDAGCDANMSKPYKREKLLEVIAEFFK